MPDIYVAPEVADVQSLHPYLADPAFRALPFARQITRQAETLVAAHGAGDTRIAMQVMCWWPGIAGRALTAVMEGAFTMADGLETMARDYGFAGWAAVANLSDAAPDAGFEAGLDAMLDGDISGLTQTLDARPQLVHQRSAFGHGATLLHYLGANGVESHRQRVPSNAVDLARLLISRGADRRAAARMYGGGQTALDLASTSAHPFHAGLAKALNVVLSPD